MENKICDREKSVNAKENAEANLSENVKGYSESKMENRELK
jgi:hypothetical protein